MIDKAYLNYVIERAGETKKELAEVIGITDRSLRDKINGRREFNINEMQKIVNHYNLDTVESMKIFFPNYDETKIPPVSNG